MADISDTPRLALLLFENAKRRRLVPRDRLWHHSDPTHPEYCSLFVVDGLSTYAVLSSDIALPWNENLAGMDHHILIVLYLTLDLVPSLWKYARFTQHDDLSHAGQLSCSPLCCPAVPQRCAFRHLNELSRHRHVLLGNVPGFHVGKLD